jgi:hypothetical protein
LLAGRFTCCIEAAHSQQHAKGVAASAQLKVGSSTRKEIRRNRFLWSLFICAWTTTSAYAGALRKAVLWTEKWIVQSDQMGLRKTDKTMRNYGKVAQRCRLLFEFSKIC